MTMKNLFNDIRLGFRIMRKRPILTAAVVFTLSLGIGANTVIFNLGETLLRRPLPVEQPDELQVLFTKKAGADGYGSLSYPDYVDYRKTNTVFSGLIAYSVLPLSFSASGQNERVWGEIVTGEYFNMLGVKPVVGRLLSPDDDKTPGWHPVVVLSHSFWQARFGGDPNIVGKPIAVNGRPYTIIGVAPAEFQGVFYVGFSAKLWIPMMQHGEAVVGSSGSLYQRDNRWLKVMGRLKPGVSAAESRASMRIMAQQLSTAYPATNKDLTVEVFPELDARPEPESAGNLSLASMVFSGLIGLVLLIACANVASLLLAQASSRQNEIAVRLALGATRFRLFQQILTENILLALLSGAASLIIAILASRAISGLRLSTDIPFELVLPLDFRGFIFTLLLSLMSGIIFGLLPALRLCRADLRLALNTEGARGTGGKTKARLLAALVVGQLTISVIVLVTAGLFVRSMQGAQQINPGFDTRNALLLSVDPGLQGYDEARTRNFYRDLLDRLKGLPRVEAATIVSPLPLDFVSSSSIVIVEGSDLKPEDNRREVLRSIVGPGYFQAMGAPLLEGRDFSDTDTGQTTKVAIINETMAKRFWSNQLAIGKRFRLESDSGPTYEVVGVAKNGRYRSLGELPRPYFYIPYSQNFSHDPMTIVLRAAGDPQALASGARNQIQSLDAQLPIFEVKTMDEHMTRSLFGSKIGAIFTGVFGLLALTLALMGLYGVIWHSVAMRTREIGIRMALGSQQSDILKMVLKQGLFMAVLGAAFGLIGAFGVGQLLAGLLYGIGAVDLAIYGGVSLIFIICALLASYFPARKATKVNPITALRAE
jgi:putative ABC transport system permease protein